MRHRARTPSANTAIDSPSRNLEVVVSTTSDVPLCSYTGGNEVADRAKGHLLAPAFVVPRRAPEPVSRPPAQPPRSHRARCRVVAKKGEIGDSPPAGHRSRIDPPPRGSRC